MTYVPKTLLDVLSLLKMEAIAPQEGDRFRRFKNTALTLTLDVYDPAACAIWQPTLRCRMEWHDESDRPWSTWGTLDDALLWLCWRPEYRRALLVREAS